MSLRVDGTGAAKRRRERRLRSWWRHEAQSVQAAVVSALHHSRDVGPATYKAPRGQKKTAEVEEAGLESHSGLRAPTPLPPGMRPEPLAEPRHWFIPGLEALCPDDGGAPSLSLPSLADRAAEVVDSSSLRFLTASALEARRKEEEERRKVEEQEKLKTMTVEEARLELRTLLAVPAPRRTAEQEERSRACRAVLAAAHKRKKKKRRKKKLPKVSSSRSLPARAARTRTSGYSSTSSSWYVYSGGVMSSVACESSFLLGMYWLPPHSANFILDCACSWSYGVMLATFIRTWWRTRAVSPSMLAGFAGYDTPRSVFPSIVHVCGYSTGAVLGQGCFPDRYCATTGPYGPESAETCVASTGAVLGQGVLPVVVTSGAYGQTVLKTAVSPQLQFVDEFVDISVVVQRQFPMVLFRTIELLQLQYTDKVIDVPVVPVLFPSAGVEMTAELPHCSRRALGCVRFYLGQCEADSWIFFFVYFQYQQVVGCICMLNYWFSSNDVICADNYIYFRFTLQDMCRSEKWELYLHGDKTIQVVCAHVQFLASGYMPVVVTTGHGVRTCRTLRSSPQLQVLA